MKNLFPYLLSLSVACSAQSQKNQTKEAHETGSPATSLASLLPASPLAITLGGDPVASQRQFAWCLGAGRSNRENGTPREEVNPGSALCDAGLPAPEKQIRSVFFACHFPILTTEPALLAEVPLNLQESFPPLYLKTSATPRKKKDTRPVLPLRGLPTRRIRDVNMIPRELHAAAPSPQPALLAAVHICH